MKITACLRAKECAMLSYRTSAAFSEKFEFIVKRGKEKENEYQLF
jgi:hypothetical protein